MNSENLFADADVIHSYSRAQAIEDGVLVDLSAGEMGELARQAGFRFPVAVTAEVFAACFELTPAAKRAGCDIKGRAWDVFYMLRNAIRRSAGGERIEFRVLVVRDRVRPTVTELVAVCGPGDQGEPVITVMFPGQD